MQFDLRTLIYPQQRDSNCSIIPVFGGWLDRRSIRGCRFVIAKSATTDRSHHIDVVFDNVVETFYLFSLLAMCRVFELSNNFWTISCVCLCRFMFFYIAFFVSAWFFKREIHPRIIISMWLLMMIHSRLFYSLFMDTFFFSSFDNTYDSLNIFKVDILDISTLRYGK